MKTQILFFIAATTLCLAALNADATTYTWVGASGGAWTTKTNWSPSTGYPSTSSDVASFNSGTTVSYSANLTIGSITTGYNSGAVVISFTGTTPTLSMNSFTLGGGGSFVVQLTFTGTGTVNVSSSPTTPYLTSFGIGAGTVFNLASGAIVTMTNNPASFSNAGTFNLLGSTFNYTTNSNSTTITNSGTINVTAGGTFSANGPIANSGTISVSSATLSLTSGGNFYGVITNSSSGIITSTNSTINIGQSDGITNNGHVSATTGTQIKLNAQSAFLTNSNSFILDASTISMPSGNTMNITNNSGGVFTANDNSTITYSGYQNYIKNAGTFNAGTSASQCIINISGQGNTTSSGACSIYNTGIFNVGSTSVINATGTDATNPNIIYNNGGTFTLMSDANGSATIGTLGAGGSCQGIFNVQRFVTGGTASDRNYRLFSCPVNKTGYTSSSSNVIDLSYLGQSVTVPSTFNGAYIAGPGTGFGSTPLHTTVNPIMYLYQESILPGARINSTFTSGKNVGITSIGTNSVTTVSTALAGTTSSDNSSGVKIPPGNGYILYYIGSNQRTTTSASVLPDNSIITATGYINQGNVPLYMWGLTPTTALTYTIGAGSKSVGVTEVGNPYPSTIDLHTVYTDNTTLQPSFYELDGINQQFDSYNATTGTSGTTPFRYVASGQGFYITTSSGGSTLTFKEDQKTTSATAPVFPSPSLLAVIKPGGQATDAVIAAKRTDALPSSITPTAEKPAGLHLKLFQDSVSYDEIGVYFSNAWSDKYDTNDTYDLDGLNPQVYLSSFSSDSVRVSINALGTYTNGKKVRLFVKAVADGSYTLSMEDFIHIDTSLYNIYLVDNQQSDSVNLVSNPKYTFNLVAADTSAFSNRFVLDVELKSLPAYQLLTFSGQKVTTGVQLNWKADNTGDYTGFVLQKLGAANSYNSLYTVQSDSATNYSYVDQHPVIGPNVYRLQQSDITGKITYSAPVTVGYNSTSPNGALTVYPNPAKSIINVNLSSNSTTGATYTAKIYNAAGVVVGHQAVNGISFTQDVSSYNLGVYIIQLTDANGNLLGLSKFVKVD